MPVDFRTLRGRALDELARELERLRAERKACFRCPRILAPGGVCEVHGRTSPPRIRKEGHGAPPSAPG
jgi:hypothetical protein